MERPSWLIINNAGMPELSDRDIACIVLSDLDYDAQLSAIQHLLRNHRVADKKLNQEIDEIKAIASRTSGIRNEFATDEVIDRFHASVYQDAAHSMAAVGMLAPLFESVFSTGLRGIGEQFFQSSQSPAHERWTQSSEDAWDCHNFWSKGRRCTHLVEGILQLSDAIGLTAYLPSDLRQTLEALFSYRNKMFHNGLEWPMCEREKFELAKKAWPDMWFERATSGGKPWIFYLSSVFVEQCIGEIEKVLIAFGAFCKQKMTSA